MIRVVLVDDHELVRSGFRLILDQAADITVVGEAGTAQEGLRLIRSKTPDVALVDVHMPGMSGLELTERVTRDRLATQIVILTVVEDARFPRRLLEAGALGYLTKGCAARELIAAVRQVAMGRRYLASDVAERLAFSTLDGDESPLEALSGRELEVAMMLARGASLNAIGDQLSISPKTVSTYKQRLLEKLGVNHVVELVELLRAHGLLEPREQAPLPREPAA